MKNQEKIDYIFNYKPKTELEKAITGDVMERIENHLNFPNSNIDDNEISKEIDYFERYMKILQIENSV